MNFLKLTSRLFGLKHLLPKKYYPKIEHFSPNGIFKITFICGLAGKILHNKYGQKDSQEVFGKAI